MSYPKYDPTNPQLLESIVCFADILGFSNLIIQSDQQDKGTDLLRDLHNILSNQYREMSELNPLGSFKSFTDNVILAYPKVEDGEGQSGSIFMSFVYFQLTMTLNSYFIRGGISLNKYYGDEHFAYGPALIEAHDLECKDAIYPRIILSAEMIKMVKVHLDYYGKVSYAPQYWHLLRDNEDGQWFINYLHGLQEDYDETRDFENYADLLKKHKNCIEVKLKEFQGIEKILTKYEWTAKYHNYFCSMHITEEGLQKYDLLIDGIEDGNFSRIVEDSDSY
ncbi:hypothetical protein B1B05_14970 [Domibacillus enclensis]|uniref:Guanylate cyclase domain-containing protein n=1 Tax=Domibacillus enclensis TaxID=1017273 RepID=A0A1N7AI27_9BACI|nr:hypothetical protein B1B05_14970 [Domibacillus enclensis]SIR38654.1 hypothetical protein SAMN05443094_107216 [Domibacillus enclensis]